MNLISLVSLKKEFLFNDRPHIVHSLTFIIIFFSKIYFSSIYVFNSELLRTKTTTTTFRKNTRLYYYNYIEFYYFYRTLNEIININTFFLQFYCKLLSHSFKTFTSSLLSRYFTKHAISYLIYRNLGFIN